MLFVLPFLVMAIAFLSGYFSLESLQSVQVKGVINMAYINQLDKSWLSAIGFVIAGTNDDLAFTYLYPADVGHYGQCRF